MGTTIYNPSFMFQSAGSPPPGHQTWFSLVQDANLATSSSTFPGVLTSIDGFNWTTAQIAENVWNSMLYGGGVFVALGCDTNDGHLIIARSTDRLTWSPVALTSPPHNFNFITNGAYGGGLFFVGCDDFIYTSPDGQTWTKIAFPAGGPWTDGQTSGYSAYGNGKFVILYPASGGSPACTFTSTDGVTWIGTALTGASQNNPNWCDLAFGAGVFVAVKYSNLHPTTNIMSSTDGVAWNDRTQGGGSTARLASVVFYNGKFVAIGEESGSNLTLNAQTSPDGAGWSLESSMPSIGAPLASLGAGQSGGNPLYVVPLVVDGTHTDALSSGDGITWSVGPPTPVINPPADLASSSLIRPIYIA